MEKWRRSISEAFFDKDLVDRNCSYPDLPAELDPYIFGFLGEGPCVMAIKEAEFEDALADGDLDLWEIGIPCKLFLRLSYRFYKGYVIADTSAYPGEAWEDYEEPELW